MYKNKLTLRLFNLIVSLATSMFLLDACSEDSESPTLTPSITSFSPTKDVEGATIVITGVNFSAQPSENDVEFNGTAATVTSATTSQLAVTVPVGATTGKITVTTNGQTATSSINFEVITPPAITEFTPTSGAVESTVTITGTNFSITASENVVKFNGTIATVTEALSTQLTVTVPTDATTGRITVTTNGKTVTSSTDFVVVTPPTLTDFEPVSGLVGSTVTITGTNFSSTASENLVEFNETPATVIGATTTQLTVTVPSNATTGKIRVTVNEFQAISTDNFVVIFPPTITDFTPVTGTLGTVVTITGTNFSTDIDENIVKINGVAATVTEATSTTLKVSVPEASTGKITVQSGTETATSATDFVYYLPVTVSTLAGEGNITTFAVPTGIAVDGSGNVYVSDRGSSAHHIKKITPSGVVTIFAGLNGEFSYPEGLAVDGLGNVYVADEIHHRIAKITPAGIVSTLAGSGTPGFADGPALTAQFNEPRGVAVDGAGNIYVSDLGNQRIRKITPEGAVSTLAGNGTLGFADGNGTEAMFRNPQELVADANGNVYVADHNNHRIRKITPTGVVSTLAGNGVAGYADGTGTSAQFSYPSGITIDASGNILVGDWGDSHIRKVTLAGVVTTMAGSVPGFAEGTGTAAKFSGVYGLAVDPSNNVLVVDQTNRRIRKIVQ